MRRAALMLIALAVASCGGQVAVRDDEFSKTVRIDGPSAVDNPLFGTKAEYHLVSFIGKAEPRAVEHRVEVNFYYDHDVPKQSFFVAADDTTAELPLKPLYFGGCGAASSCMKLETIGIGLSDAVLRRHALTGYRIKVAARSGDAKVLILTPAMLIRQLNAVDARIDRGSLALGDDKPHLGLFAIDATANPYDGPPRGLIVVEVADGSPAARAGVRPGDIVLDFDRRAVRTFSDVIASLNRLSRGKTVPLEVERDGRPVAIDVRL